MTATLQPRWQDLFTKLLQAEHWETATSEVEPYQAQPALGFDLALAWNEAMLPGLLLADTTAKVSNHPPAAWSSARHLNWEGLFPCCIGMAPQFLQRVDGILNDASAFFRKTPQLRATGTVEATLDAKSPYSQLALARLLGDQTGAERLIEELDGELLRQNERAAQLWFSGSRAEARHLWDSLNSNQPVIAFNQGIAALAAGDRPRAQACLRRAVKGFEETTGWNHLASLYLAVEE